MNRELFQKVKARILAEPHRVNMRVLLREPACNTVGCIAGHAIIESEDPIALMTPAHRQWGTAVSLLRLEESEAEMLFNFHEYATDEGEISTPYLKLANELNEWITGTPAYAEVVARAIDLCIARYDAGEWS